MCIGTVEITLTCTCRVGHIVRSLHVHMSDITNWPNHITSGNWSMDALPCVTDDGSFVNLLAALLLLTGCASHT